MIKSSSAFFESLIFFLLLALSLYLSISGIYGKTVIEGISLWLSLVVPSLFPYLFITAIMSSLSTAKKISNRLSPIFVKTFNVGGGSGYAFLLSVISGYPIGAKSVSDLKIAGVLNEDESVRAACLCSTSSPTFLIGSVGAITFNNRTFGILLFLAHIISAILNGIIFSFYKRKSKPNDKILSSSIKPINVLYDSAYSAVISLLVVGSLITIFYLLTEVLFNLKIISPIVDLLTALLNSESLAKGITFGFFECTRGIKELSSLPQKVALPFCAFISGFGGISVIAQSLAFLKRAKIKTAPFLLSKVTAAVISLMLGFIFSFLL